MNLFFEILPWALVVLAAVLIIKQFEGHDDEGNEPVDQREPRQQRPHPYTTLSDYHA